MGSTETSTTEAVSGNGGVLSSTTMADRVAYSVAKVTAHLSAAGLGEDVTGVTAWYRHSTGRFVVDVRASNPGAITAIAALIGTRTHNTVGGSDADGGTLIYGTVPMVGYLIDVSVYGPARDHEAVSA